MLLTKIWTATLAILATAFLAGMFLLSLGHSGGFSDSDQRAIRAVTQAGLAALAADIQASPVSLAPSLYADSRLGDALDREAAGDEDVENPEFATVEQAFHEVANEALLNDYPLMSAALVDKAGSIVARTGVADQLFEDVTALPNFQNAQTSAEPSLFSATLEGKLYAVGVSRAETSPAQRRIVAVQALDLGGASFLRRSLGADSPAGLVREGDVLGEPIGGAEPAELTAIVAEHIAEVPPDGASKVLEVGEGKRRRIGAIGRVPGPAGKGDKGAFFVVLSTQTIGDTQKDLAQALNEAMAAEEGLGGREFGMLGGLLAISVALSIFLPRMEHSGPLGRLAAEFKALGAGTQKQIFHDTYGGSIRQVAAAAVASMEALRVGWEDQIEFDGEDEEGESEGQTRPRSRGTRSVRSTRGSRRAGGTRGTRRAKAASEQPAEAQQDAKTPDAIDLPPAEDEPGQIETHSMSKESAKAPSSSVDRAPPPAAPAAPAPTLTDEVEDASLSAALVDDEPEDLDTRETYFHEVFDQFVALKEECGENTAALTYEKFAKKLRKNTETLLARDGVADVKFNVYIKDGKAALKAKVVKG